MPFWSIRCVRFQPEFRCQVPRDVVGGPLIAAFCAFAAIHWPALYVGCLVGL